MVGSLSTLKLVSVFEICPVSTASVFAQRRARLLEILGRTAAGNAELEGFALPAGWSRPRNFAHNVFPFRAESHFLYLVGRHIEGAVLLFTQGKWELYVLPLEPDAALWHGPQKSEQAWQEELGLPVRGVDQLALTGDPGRIAILPPQDEESATWISQIIGRNVTAQSGPDLMSIDALLASAMVELRLTHDSAGLQQMRFAGQITARAHRAGMRATRGAQMEAIVRGAMEGELTAHGLSPAYISIVTTHGEVLHSSTSRGKISDGDLLLCDVGGETEEGFASDITRTWPTNGRFSATQRDVYQLVLNVQKSAIVAARANVEYVQLHWAALREMAAGLAELGILRGATDDLVELGAASIFFPHGLGHLLGVDVHDMEDLGDRAGYGPGRARSEHVAQAPLRLDRQLMPGMVVTIEPGFYQVPMLLERARLDTRLSSMVDWNRLEAFADVRGIRIEDDVLITADASEVLSQDAPKEIEDLESAYLAS